MEKTKDQVLMEILLLERSGIRKQMDRLKDRLEELNRALYLVIQRRYEKEFK